LRNCEEGWKLKWGKEKEQQIGWVLKTLITLQIKKTKNQNILNTSAYVKVGLLVVVHIVCRQISWNVEEVLARVLCPIEQFPYWENFCSNKYYKVLVN